MEANQRDDDKKELLSSDEESDQGNAAVGKYSECTSPRQEASGDASQMIEIGDQCRGDDSSEGIEKSNSSLDPRLLSGSRGHQEAFFRHEFDICVDGAL